MAALDAFGIDPGRPGLPRRRRLDRRLHRRPAPARRAPGLRRRRRPRPARRSAPRAIRGSSRWSARTPGRWPPASCPSRSTLAVDRRRRSSRSTSSSARSSAASARRRRPDRALVKPQFEAGRGADRTRRRPRSGRPSRGPRAGRRAAPRRSGLGVARRDRLAAPRAGRQSRVPARPGGARPVGVSGAADPVDWRRSRRSQRVARS